MGDGFLEGLPESLKASLKRAIRVVGLIVAASRVEVAAGQHVADLVSAGGLLEAVKKSSAGVVGRRRVADLLHSMHAYALAPAHALGGFWSLQGLRGLGSMVARYRDATIDNVVPGRPCYCQLEEVLVFGSGRSR